MKWLGVHYSDLFDGSGEALVASEALQPWTISDARVFSGIYSSVESLTSVRTVYTYWAEQFVPCQNSSTV